MGNELTTTQKETRLAMPAPEFSNDQIRLLGETVAKGCDQNELAFFLQVAKLKRLDPFTGQIHVVKRWDSMAGKDKITIQTGIDGFRVIAARTDELAGIDDPEYDTEEGEHPNVAKVTVYRYGRNDEKITYKATARWSEYAQTKRDGGLGPMWKKLPWLMLGKCAESLALRKAFPDELSGMYTNEEMEQADNDQPGAPAGKPQVQMPRSTDEKKADLAKQQAKAETVKQNPPAAQQGAAQGQPKAEEISGEIEKVSPGKGAQEGTLWLVVNKKVICVPANLIDAEMCVGAKILIMAVELKGGEIKKYLAVSVEIVVPPAQEGEIIDAEVSEPETKHEPGTPDPVLEEARAAGLGGIFDDAPRKAASKENPGTPDRAPTGEATKPGTIGIKRAKRIYAIIGQNHKNTNFTEAELKRFLSALPAPLEHLRDLEIGMYEQVEKWATGEEDFQDFWRD
jgi:phage recombination protein Bet